MPEDDRAITPSTKVADLLADYPELEDVLIGMAPPFRKLKNPVLRRSVAKVASLRQAAAVARLPVDEVINKLRAAVGHEAIWAEEAGQDSSYFTPQPDWFVPRSVVASIDERDSPTADEMPLKRVIHEATRLEEGEVLELVTTFLPAPGIDIMKAKGFRVWPVEGESGLIRTYFSKSPNR
ncbi:MAG: DUF1858 domain-containing protein [Vicinamibacterales bacterium]|jgi:hypothetical protein|nr:DUF1858 domain-containing protein [Vicinamibacterales bacterium]